MKHIHSKTHDFAGDNFKSKSHSKSKCPEFENNHMPVDSYSPYEPGNLETDIVRESFGNFKTYVEAEAEPSGYDPLEHYGSESSYESSPSDPLNEFGSEPL